MSTVRSMSLNEALKAAVAALGGAKEVGRALWPAKSGELAMQRVDHCLERGNANKFSDEEIDFIFSWCEREGFHAAMEGWGAGRGYTVTPANKEAVIAELQTRAVELAQETAQLHRDIDALSGLSPATVGLIRRAHSKVFEP